MNGGALSIGTAAVKISNSKFITNTVGNDGSAVQIRGNNPSSLLGNEVSYIKNTLFSGNVGLSTGNQSMGTVLFAGYHGVKTQFDNCEFFNNLASA